MIHNPGRTRRYFRPELMVINELADGRQITMRMLVRHIDAVISGTGAGGRA